MPSEHGVQGVADKSEMADGVRVHPIQLNAYWPLPQGIMLGEGHQPRHLELANACGLNRLDIEWLLADATWLVKPPLGTTVVGRLILKSTVARKRAAGPRISGGSHRVWLHQREVRPESRSLCRVSTRATRKQLLLYGAGR